MLHHETTRSIVVVHTHVSSRFNSLTKTSTFPSLIMTSTVFLVSRLRLLLSLVCLRTSSTYATGMLILYIYKCYHNRLILVRYPQLEGRRTTFGVECDRLAYCLSASLSRHFLNNTILQQKTNCQITGLKSHFAISIRPMYFTGTG